MPRLAPLGDHEPSKVGPYRLLGRIGRGGQGSVYLGVDLLDGGEAAVKVLNMDSGDRARVQRLLHRELVNANKVAAGVTAKILRFDVNADLPYIASEFIEGPTLAEVVRDKGVLAGGSLSSVAMQTMSALEAIHAANVIHCDLNPANIILSPHGPRVIDFGIAMALESTHRIGEIAGTCYFMAPEQIRNMRLTSAVDLFSWGSTMVYTATGKYAFPGVRRDVVMQRILRSAPQLYGIEEPLRGLIIECLRKDPPERPSAGQARQRLFSRKASTNSAREPRQFTPGVASPPAPAARSQPAPPAETRIERPPIRPRPSSLGPHLPVAPPATDGLGRRKAFTILIAVMLFGGSGLAWANVYRPTGRNPVPPVSTSAPTALQIFNADWRSSSCAPTPANSGQVARIRCESVEEGIPVEKYCVEYANGDHKRNGRPKDGWPNIRRVAWADEWFRDDDDRRGTFIAYTLKEGNRSAIWWESDRDLVACIAFAPPGQDETLLRLFHSHGYRLRHHPHPISS